MQKKFDIQTAKKLLSSYAEKINYYMKENKLLRNELNDAKTTLGINKEILYKNLNEQIKEKNKIILDKLKEENDRLTKKLDELYQDKIILEKKLYKTQQELEDLIVQRQEKDDFEKTNSFKYTNIIKEKESIIKQLKRELNKYYRDDCNSTKEIIIGEPDKIILEMNNELIETRELINKFSKLLHLEKRKSVEQEEQINKLKQKIQNIKKKKRVKENIENIQMFNYILTSDESENYSEKGSSFCTLESPLIKFPEKIKQTKYLSTEISEYNVPKLDFSKLLNKYTPLKSIDVVEGVKETNRSCDEYIDKLKFQIKIFKNKLIRLKKKNRHYKKLVSMLKQQCIKLRNNLQLSSSTKDKTVITNNINNNNIKKENNSESMEANTSNIDIESNITESDFNYIIKEFNKEIDNHLN